MVDISINNKSYKVQKNYTILQACEEIGIQIPRFCYHERLSIAGNCRMCLVELENSMKPVASCAMGVSPGMNIYTNTLLVKKAREGVMEFLLANHPLDCPICDQGGECDLQDQAMLFGNDRGRFYEHKRSVSNKDCGLFIKTVMTRCIHCTRCVRFLGEVAGAQELGTTGRGVSTEIGNYVSSKIKFGVSGNIIDLCPVGALTSKPYAFKARSWELKRTETIDTLDSMGSNISVHTKGKEILRILPVLHESVNEEWINDRTRFNYDGFAVQRFNSAYEKKNGRLIKNSWKKVFESHIVLANSGLNVKNQHIKYVGQGVSIESVTALKKMSNRLGVVVANENNFFMQKNLDFRSYYSFNSTYAGLGKTDFCVLLGLSLDAEMPLLSVRLRKEQRSRNLFIGILGGKAPEGLQVMNLGTSMFDVVRFVEGRHKACTLLTKANKPTIMLSDTLSLSSGRMVDELNNLFRRKSWNGLNILTRGSSAVNLYDEGLGASEAIVRKDDRVSAVNIFGLSIKKADLLITSHGSAAANMFDKVLPCSTNYEKDSLFLNGEGRVQFSKFLFSGPKNAKEDTFVFEGLQNYVTGFSSKSVLGKQGKEKGYTTNLPRYETFVAKSNKLKRSLTNYIISSEHKSIINEDYVSLCSRMLTKAAVIDQDSTCVNYKN